MGLDLRAATDAVFTNVTVRSRAPRPHRQPWPDMVAVLAGRGDDTDAPRAGCRSSSDGRPCHSDRRQRLTAHEMGESTAI